MASFLAEKIMELCEGRLDYGHAYYYCDFRRDEDETCNFLCWIVAQLCYQKRTVPIGLQELLARGTKVSYKGLVAALQFVVSTFSSVYIVIDGLDESKNRDNLLTLLQMLASSVGFSKLRIIASSREEEDIKRALTGIGSNISMSNPLVDEDISRFIQSAIYEDRKMRTWPEDLQLEVKEKLTAGAKGM
jgi:hypothetical protein